MVGYCGVEKRLQRVRAGRWMRRLMQSSSQEMTVISFGGWPLRSRLSDPCDWLCWQQEGTPTSVLPATSSQEPQPQLHSSFQEGQSGYKLWTLGISSPGPGACGPGKSPGPGGRMAGCPGLDGPLGPPLILHSLLHSTMSEQPAASGPSSCRAS